MKIVDSRRIKIVKGGRVKKAGQDCEGGRVRKVGQDCCGWEGKAGGSKLWRVEGGSRLCRVVPGGRVKKAG